MSSTPLFQRPETRSGKVPVKIKFGQGIGTLAGQHKDWAFNTLLVLFYSQLLGLPATYASIILAIALIADAITDPLVGAASDSFRSTWGRRHPFMLIAAIPTSISMYCLFSPPDFAEPLWLAAWLLFFTLGTRLSYTFFAVPWAAIAAELSTDYTERTVIMTYRMAVGWIGGVIFIFIAYSVIFASPENSSSGLMNREAYDTFALVISTLMFIWMNITAFVTLGQRRFLPQPSDSIPTVTLRDIAQRVITAFGSKNFTLLFSATLISAAVTGTGQFFDIFMNVYFWQFSTDEIAWFSLSVVGAILSFLTATALQRRFEKHQIMLTCFAAVIILSFMKVLFRFWDIWPENGDPALLWIFVGHTSVAAYFASLLLIMFASMMADLVDEQELRVGLRQEGVFSAGITFAAKTTAGIGLVIGGLILDHLVGLPREADPTMVAQDTLNMLAISDGILVPVFNVFAIVLLLRYTLTRDKLSDIQSELQERATT